MDIKPFDDVRNTPYSNINETINVENKNVLKSLTFNDSTKFSDPLLAEGILTNAQESPLGVWDLHRNDIMGKHINIAIIDQPCAMNHPEYDGKFLAYLDYLPKEDKEEEKNISSMHGPAVMSLLVGQNCGVAPEAKVLYCAVPSWNHDSFYYADALRGIIRFNESQQDHKKIKFVAVSAAPSGKASQFVKNTAMWDEAVKQAQANGIVVVDCTDSNGFVAPGYVSPVTNRFVKGFPLKNKENSYFKTFLEKVELWAKAKVFDKMIQKTNKLKPIEYNKKDQIYVPTSYRTVAESYDNKHFGYAYYSQAGLSFGVPYTVGVLALGQQINRDLSAKELKRLLIETSKKGVINPKKFIAAVKETVKDEENEEGR